MTDAHPKTSTTTLARGRHIWVAAIIDLAIIAFFALYGRMSHGMRLEAAEVWRVAWPFLAGLAIAWLVAFVWRRPLAPVRSGIPITLITVIAGMLLRYGVEYGGAVPVSVPFIIVSTSLFALLFIGWRGIATLLVRRRARRSRR